MNIADKPLEELIRDLPPDIEIQARSFIEFLLSKQEHKETPVLHQDWAGGLREYREKYTSLELQQKALDWRGD